MRCWGFLLVGVFFYVKRVNFGFGTKSSQCRIEFGKFRPKLGARRACRFAYWFWHRICSLYRWIYYWKCDGVLKQMEGAFFDLRIENFYFLDLFFFLVRSLSFARPNCVSLFCDWEEKRLCTIGGRDLVVGFGGGVSVPLAPMTWTRRYYSRSMITKSCDVDYQHFVPCFSQLLMTACFLVLFLSSRCWWIDQLSLTAFPAAEFYIIHLRVYLLIFLLNMHFFFFFLVIQSHFSH